MKSCTSLTAFFLSCSISLPCISGCYSTWSALSSAVSRNGAGGTFTICPNTVLTPDPANELGLYIWTSKYIKVQCGSNGSRENQCTIDGPPRHFTFGRVCCSYIASMDVELSGITMRGASDRSIFIRPGGYGTYKFNDCVWKENDGLAGSVYVQPYTASGVSDVSFNNCDFIENEAWCGPIYEQTKANFFVEDCLFLNNEAKAIGNLDSNFCASAIHAARYGTTLSIANSCFVGNVANGPSVVHIDDSPNVLRKNTNNYAADNVVGLAEPWSINPHFTVCPKGVFVDEFYHADCWCKNFDANSCPLARFQHPDLTDPPASTDQPTETMTDIPTGPPTTSPNGDTSKVSESMMPKISLLLASFSLLWMGLH